MQTNIIYRYFDKQNNVIYVGLTSRPLKRRVKEHSIEQLQSETDHIDFAMVPSEADMRMYELFYINKYQPKYNKRDLYKDGNTINLPELTFQPYLTTSDAEIVTRPQADMRNYLCRCPGGVISIGVIDPYSKHPDTVALSITGKPVLNKSAMQELIKTLCTAYDDIK